MSVELLTPDELHAPTTRATDNRNAAGRQAENFMVDLSDKRVPEEHVTRTAHEADGLPMSSSNENDSRYN